MGAENGKERDDVGRRKPPAEHRFTQDKQPDPEAKKDGWRKLRAERLLTQAIIKKMTQGRELEEYVDKMAELAKKGNPKAIETINKGLEDDIVKVAMTDTDGNQSPIQVIQIPDNGRNNTSTEPQP